MSENVDGETRLLLGAFEADGSHREVLVGEALVDLLPSLRSLNNSGWELGLVRGGALEEVDIEDLSRLLEVECSNGRLSIVMLSKGGVSASVFVSPSSTGVLQVQELDFDPREVTSCNVSVIPELLIVVAHALNRSLYLCFEGTDVVISSFLPDGQWKANGAEIRQHLDGLEPVEG